MKINVHSEDAALDIYRKRAHRDASRLLHSLSFLEVPFAALRAGPDFVRGTDLERRHEHWEYAWAPHTESRLVELSLYGSTVEEATITLLQERIRALEAAGTSRSSLEAVRCSRARVAWVCIATRSLLKLLAANIAEDPRRVARRPISELRFAVLFARAARSARSGCYPELAVAAYRRACYLLPSLADLQINATRDARLAERAARILGGGRSRSVLTKNVFMKPSRARSAELRSVRADDGGRRRRSPFQ